MNILITGGLGFIGSNFIRYLFNKYPDINVINLDLITYAGNIDNLKDIDKKSNYKLVKGSICDKDLVNNLIKKVDYVVNFAAETHVDNSIINPEIFIETNVKGTGVLLEACRKNGIKKYLQISTDEVYGSIEGKGYFYENTLLNPSSPYSASKASADMLVKSYYKTFELPILITRCSNNYGAYQYPEKLIPFFVSKLLNDEKVPVYGDGLNVRDWLYVQDHCEAIDLVLQNGKLGEVYNIGDNNEKTNLEITKILLDLMNKDESSIEFVKDRLGHDRRYAICSDKIKTELGFNPKTDIEKGLNATVQWYLNNQDWIKLIKNRKQV